MTRRLVLMLAAVAVLAGLVVADRLRAPAPVAVPVPQPQAEAPQRPDVNPLASVRAEDLTDLAAHPLFSPSRQPPRPEPAPSRNF